MAFSSMLRRASSSVLPLAIRTVRSSRTYHSAAFTAFSTEKRNLTRELTRRSWVPILQFSTETAAAELSAHENLIRVLESEIQCAEESDDDNSVQGTPPDEFPFKIQDNRGERTILLTREYQDEIIKVEVDMPDIYAEEEADEEGDENDEEGSDESIHLVVSVSKDNGGLQLEFGVTAYPNEISIDHLSMQPGGSEDDLTYDGPEFSDLDPNFQKALLKYLEVRGIKPCTTNCLRKYMVKKDSEEYLEWLKKLKKFIEH
ncbi:hypothetical protein FNV43_RR09801 [Rhamnella rubrinervis]|uniref:Mitochondrial glycoprotein n=1 Tax=Rhamnella rubrinervis TaxID=2594499 RepID=A0A8K0MKA9_9ROSA|nr:hypothetical protein FNV43_RR09801 [Rhamnella rubrinervis]